jgi:hypothetical protein
MSKLAWTPWHKVVQVRDELKTGELSLAIFAADLYDVAMQKGRRPVYEDPEAFFSLTYPTYNLRELARDVVTRLAAKNDKAVRQLELTYGGGKTHALITLFHLTNDPARLPDLPAVQEFLQHIGMPPPKARIAVLAFDKLDVEKGMEVRAPDGEVRWLKNPWSVLAYQIAGAEGLKLLHAKSKSEERDSAPAENLLTDLLSLPNKEGLSTLILIDEVLMYAREKIGLDPAWRAKLVNFFQYLTQAVTKIDRCAMVASLLATDPGKSDTLGKEVTQELYAVFRREREEGVQPVVKEDVAEVLRRRFFSPESIRDREAFRPHVVAALKGIADLDEQVRKEGKGAEERFLKSFPFHPELTEVFYGKWTNLEGFQRTRGILRTFALALRGAEGWDSAPLVGPNAFLKEPKEVGLSEAARELSTVAATEEYEGKRQDWTGILEGELAKVREIQQEMTGLKFREAEQAVIATFLHSQPIGQKALTRELLLLLGPTRPDKIELEKALSRWGEVSWFLDEGALQDAVKAPDGRKELPKSWRLGSKPNLRQMHHDACLYRVPSEVIESQLLKEIQKLKSLTAGASAAGAKVHNLPNKPGDIEDDGEFHYAVLGPKAASDAGKPSAEAKRFLNEKTSGAPRGCPNAVVVVAPSRDGLEAARNRIRDYLGWEEVRSQLKAEEMDPIREATLTTNLEESRRKIPEAIQQAYCIVVTISDKNETQALKITAGDEPLFQRIKADRRARIQDTAIAAQALLPGGPYDVWREGETSRWIKDLVGAFAQSVELPKMLNRQAILDTVVLGCKEGLFVVQARRPDRSVRTFWRQEPESAVLREAATEAVLPEAATLTDLHHELLLPGALPDLWQAGELSLKEIYDYFAGGRVVRVQKESYEEPLAIPKASREVIEAAITAAVREGKLWLTAGPASLLAEDIPAGLLTEEAALQPPPSAISPMDVLPANLPEAWTVQTTSALAVSAALSKKLGKSLPWITVRNAIDGAFRARMLERAAASGPWPCDFAEAHRVQLQLPTESARQGSVVPVSPLKPGVLVAEAELRPNQIQDLADQVAEIVKAAAGLELKFNLRVELGGPSQPSDEIVARVNELLRGVADKLKLGADPEPTPES